MGPDLDAYRLYYRFLETDDEFFNYNTSDVPVQGRWYVCGLYLPEDILKKIYSEQKKIYNFICRKIFFCGKLWTQLLLTLL